MPRAHKPKNGKQPIEYTIEIKIISGNIYKLIANDHIAARAFGDNAVRFGFWIQADDEKTEIIIPPRWIEYIKIYPKGELEVPTVSQEGEEPNDQAMVQP